MLVAAPGDTSVACRHLGGDTTHPARGATETGGGVDGSGRPFGADRACGKRWRRPPLIGMGECERLVEASRKQISRLWGAAERNNAVYSHSPRPMNSPSTAQLDKSDKACGKLSERECWCFDADTTSGCWRGKTT